jgi:hypothetical protein
MRDAQLIVEKIYSKKSVSDVVRATIKEDNPIILDMAKAIEKYRYTEYSYPSKVKRVIALDMHASIDLAIEIAVLVLPIKTISPIQSVCALLGPQLGYTNLLDGIKTASELIAVCEEAGLYDIFHNSHEDNETGTLGIQPKYELEDSVQAYVKEVKYLPPMLCKPLDWKGNNRGGGNLTGSGSVLLGRMNHNEHHQALSVINTLQGIAWSLDVRMVEFVETSKKDLDTHEKKADFNFMKETSEQVYRELLDQGNKFYFVWKRDSRGRSYSQGYHVNLQANSYKKSLLNFHKKEMLTDEIYI